MEGFWFGQVVENGMFVWPNLSASKKKRNVSGYLCTCRENGMFLVGLTSPQAKKKKKKKKRGMFLVTCVQALAEKMECFWLPLCKQRKWNVSGWPNLSASTKNVMLLVTCVQADTMECFWLA